MDVRWTLGIWAVASALGCTTEQDHGSHADAGQLLHDGGSSADAAMFDASAPAPDAGPSEIPVGALRVFVTRSTYAGDLGGLAGADERCMAAAASAGLRGQWVAWLSSSYTDAIERIEGVGPWYRLDGVMVFNNTAHLRTTPLVPIDRDEFGEPGCNGRVWTGTGTGGDALPIGRYPHCQNWTAGWSANSDGTENDAIAGSCSELGGWTDHQDFSARNFSCGWDAHLYCFEVRRVPVLPDAGPPDAGPPDAGPPCVPVVNAKRVFVTSSTYSGNLMAHGGGTSGLEGADNLCNLVASAAGLGGSWTAWLSSDSEDAIDRVPDVGPWYLVDQCTRVFPNRAAIAAFGPEVPIMITETGELHDPVSVWTGTGDTGRADLFNCNDWTNDQPIGGYEGLIGSPSRTDSFWTDGPSNPCRLRHSLYCVER